MARHLHYATYERHLKTSRTDYPMKSVHLSERQTKMVQATIEAEQAACPGCQQYRDMGGPSHFSGHLANQTFYNRGCESRGRMLQPDLTFTGYVHCSCDTCF